MFVPFFPLVGVDPVTVFTPLTVGLVLLSGLCGIGITVLLDRLLAVPQRPERRHPEPSSLPKAA
jgi:hypothetical protein